MKISSMNYLFGQGVKNVWTNRIMSMASFCILMVSLLLIGFTMLFIANINSIVGSVENKNEVIIFLDDDVSDEQIEQMQSKLTNMYNISNVEFYSKEQAFADVKASMENADELFAYVGEDSPLPDSFRVKVKDISSMSDTLMSINKMDGIYTVKAPNDFVNILVELKSFISILSIAVLVALVAVSMIVISNASRASVEMRKREISIMKLVGATNTFIKVPFFVEGLFIGILAGGASSAITWICYDKIINMLAQDTTIWTAVGITGLIPLDNFKFNMVIAYLAAGALISAIGTVISTRKYLKV